MKTESILAELEAVKDRFAEEAGVIDVVPTNTGHLRAAGTTPGRPRNDGRFALLFLQSLHHSRQKLRIHKRNLTENDP